MRYAGDPGREAPVFCISSLLDGQDGFDKSLLKYIVGKILAFDDSMELVEDSVLMTLQKRIKSLIIALRISLNQLLVGHAQIFCHSIQM